MTVPPLFLYGTLRDGDILAAVLGRSVGEGQLVAATAPACAAVYFPDQLYPALVRRPGAVAPGVLLLHASEDDIRALDAFEGDEYRRGPIAVMTAATGPLAAEVYWPAVAIAPSALDWTLERWTREHKPQILAREIRLGRAARLGTARR
jgi:gamma-glutamylcyclotransferase (GGCT)/AIG2-like uncharacterized protein YtfP